MMRVAYVLPFLQRPAGWRSHACAFIAAMRKYVEPIIFVAAEDERIAHHLFPTDLIYVLPVTQDASFSNRRGLYRLVECLWAIRRGRLPLAGRQPPAYADIRAAEIDLVHSLEAYPTGLVGSRLAQFVCCPHVITTHGTYGVLWYEKKMDRIAYQDVLKKTRLVCPVSHGTADLLRKYFGSSLKQTRLLPILNGNSFTRQVTREQAFERTPPLAPTIVTIGDVKPRKGQLASLEAFALVQAEIPEARYWIVGAYHPENAYFRQMQDTVVDRGLRNVEFRGLVSDAELRQAYEGASLFALTPQMDGLHFEGFGLVYLEAGAYGLPVVATRSGGVPDAVHDGETGLLASEGDVSGIANAMLRLLRDPQLAQQMGRANRLWAETLTWERTAAEQFAAYNELTNEDHTPLEVLPHRDLGSVSGAKTAPGPKTAPDAKAAPGKEQQ